MQIIGVSFSQQIYTKLLSSSGKRLVRERISISDQGKAVGIMANQIPQDRFPEVVAWIYPLMDHNDRENMTRIWQIVMPPPAFDQAKLLIRNAIGDDWSELTRRIPTLG